MQKGLFLFFFFISIIFIDSKNGFAQKDSVKRVILGWDFFKNDKPLDAQADVMVNGGMIFNYKPVKTSGTNYKLTADITIKLDSAKSYLDFTKRYNEPNLLNHQQGLIDIATIYANKLKDTLKQVIVNPSNYHMKAKQLYNLIGEQLLEKQKSYTLETKFSTDTLMNKKWDLYFKSSLGLK